MRLFTTADMLAEIADDKPIMAERADWFRSMLQNAIENANRKIAWFDKSRAELGDVYDVDGSIENQRGRIARYSDAVAKLNAKIGSGSNAT